MNLPLKNIKVLDLTRLIPGGYCTVMLGDFGAEVIKVEEPNVGDYDRQIGPFNESMASRFLILNRNKKSVALNLKEGEGQNIFLKMVRNADVLIEGFRPGTMEKLNLDYENLKEVNSALIYCSISSFGQYGTYRDMVAHDGNILGMAGYFDVSGTKDGVPAMPGIQISDVLAGTNAALGIIMSLLHREKTGHGQFVDISMFDGIIAWMFEAMKYAFAGTEVPRKGEGRLWGGLPNYNLYKTKDDKYIFVGALENKFKQALMDHLGLQKDNSGERKSVTTSDVKDSDYELYQSLQEIFLKKTRNEWLQELEKLNICVSPVNTVEEAIAQAQDASRKMIFETFHPLIGKIKQISSPLKFSDIQSDEDRSPAPKLGEHTSKVLGDLGYDKSKLQSLINDGIIKQS